MGFLPDSVLDAIETQLADALRRDAAASRRMEATARVLLALAPGEEVRMCEVAARIARDPSTVTRFVVRAAGQGLVEARAATEDRRERRVRLTAAGLSARDDLLRRRQAFASEVSRGVQARTGLGPDEVDWFLAALFAALTNAPPG